MNRQRNVAEGQQCQRHQPCPDPSRSFGPWEPPPHVCDPQGGDRRKENAAEHVAVHRDDDAETGHDPPGGSAARPRPPCCCESDRARERDEVRVPDERRLVDSARGYGHEESRNRASDGPTDRPGKPPRDPDRGDARERDRPDHAEWIRPGQRGCGCQKVVVEDAVVKVADRRRWAEKRQLAPGDERPQNEHVVALVRVPRPASRQVDEPKRRGQQQQAREDEPVEVPLGDRSAKASEHRSAQARAGSSSSSGSGAGADRARLPRTVIAPGGSGSSGRPAARARALATLIAS